LIKSQIPVNKPIVALANYHEQRHGVVSARLARERGAVEERIQAVRQALDQR
jgi:hypothetical protein